MSDLLPTPEEAMASAREILTKLDRDIVNAQLDARDDCTRYRHEADERQRSRWRECEDMIRPLRAQREVILRAMANVSGRKVIEPMIIEVGK